MLAILGAMYGICFVEIAICLVLAFKEIDQNLFGKRN